MTFDVSRLVREVTSDNNAEALFSEDGTCRYLLRRSWGTDLFATRELWAIIVGLNPSKAGAFVSDQTISKDVGFSRRVGCHAMVKLNLYPLVSTDPAGLESVADPVRDNDAFIKEFVARIQATDDTPSFLTIAAWGSHPMATKTRIDAVLKHLPGPVMCFGHTRDGQPRHTSRIGYDTPLVVWKGAA